MHLLQLIAQAIAQKNDSQVITLVHMRKAVSMLELNHDDQAEALLTYLDMRRPYGSSSPELIMKMVSDANSTKPLPLAPRVAKMFEMFGTDFVCYRVPALLGANKGDVASEDANPPSAPRAISSFPASNASTALQEEAAASEKVSKEPSVRRRRDTPPSLSSGGVAIVSDDLKKGEDIDFRAIPPPKAAELASWLRKFLNERLMGQSQVTDALADGLVHQALRGERRGPLACLFLIGPSATGKTRTVELIAEALTQTGNVWPLKTIDMSSMVSTNQAFALTGMSKGYSEAVPGELTDFVRLNPRSIVVLDNIDNAHPNNQNVILPLFDSGYLKDQFGFYTDNDHTKARLAPDEVDFSNTILIITTNAAAGSLANADFQAYLDEHPDEAQEAVFGLLAKQVSDFREGLLPSFSTELLSRLSAELVLIYRPLDLPALQQIARTTWDQFVQNFGNAYGCTVSADELPTLMRAACLSFGGQLDARKVTGSRLENLLFSGIIDWLQANPQAKVAKVRFELAEGFGESLERMLEQLADKDPVRGLYRKQRKLGFELETLGDAGDEIRVRLSSPRWDTAVRPGDLGGKGGLQSSIPACGFEDIAGHERVKNRLREVIRILQKPQQLQDWGIGLPRGMLLLGPPGTGKTMLAKAVAKEADLPFIATTGPDILNIDHMHAVFERARHYAPCVVFIDEIDVLGSRSGSGYAVPINQLLAELDGFASQAGGVFTIAATNYPEKIDPAILRAGRLDLHIEVQMLDPPARLYFFERLRKLPGGDKLDLEELVRFSSGTTGADLERVRRELALELVRSGAAEITQAQAVEMISVVKYGERRDAHQIQSVLEHVAYHEAGHAIVSMVLRPARKLEQITIVPRARAAGFTAFQSDLAPKPMTREGVLSEIAIRLGGRIAQELQYSQDGVDQGASDDLLQATRLALQAITHWGLDEVVGDRTLIQGDGALEKIPDGRMDWWFKQGRLRAQNVLENRRKMLDAVADALVRFETLSEQQFEEIAKNHLHDSCPPEASSIIA